MRKLLCVVVLAACGGGETSGVSSPGPVEAYDQRPGDPAAGYAYLVNGDYVRCGLPTSAYDQIAPAVPPSETLPGREGRNAQLPYFMTALTTDTGVEVVGPNCLVCHAGRIDGTLTVGLGAADQDLTFDTSAAANLAGGLITDETERAEWAKWLERMRVIAPHTITKTVGVNAADNLALALFAHRDRKTLAWSQAPILPEPPLVVLAVDVPPWWRMAKKNAMFYTGGGRRDHARIMMTASALCTDSVEEAEEIDSHFPDVRAYIASLEPPAYPFPIDEALATDGREVFEAACSRCHGSYDVAGDTYPNLIVKLDEVGTDPLLASGSTIEAQPYVEWFNESFYGERATLAPAAGYYAPPLDGIWATAPFLHNGSVPTLAALLESETRPAYWTRTFDSTDYDQDAVGWRFTALETGQADEPSSSRRKLIYDTTNVGYGNGGHTFGDDLSSEDRRAVLEYLKTL